MATRKPAAARTRSIRRAIAGSRIGARRGRVGRRFAGRRFFARSAPRLASRRRLATAALLAAGIVTAANAAALVYALRLVRRRDTLDAPVGVPAAPKAAEPAATDAREPAAVAAGARAE